MSIMNFISHLGSAIARETDGSARSSEVASEGKEGEEGEEREEGDGPSDLQPVGGGPIEPPSNKGGCGCFGYSRRVHHSSSETAYPREQGSRDGSAALRAHPAKISRAWGALRGSGSSACVASSPA